MKKRIFKIAKTFTIISLLFIPSIIEAKIIRLNNIPYDVDIILKKEREIELNNWKNDLREDELMEVSNQLNQNEKEQLKQGKEELNDYNSKVYSEFTIKDFYTIENPKTYFPIRHYVTIIVGTFSSLIFILFLYKTRRVCGEI